MALIQLLRPTHWVKNLFLFIPLFLSGQLFNWDKFPPLILGFIAVSLIASGVYIINDYRDVAADRMHLEKRKRPLAAGTVSTSQAFGLLAFCLIAGFAIAWFVNKNFFGVLLLYFSMNLGYSFGLKNISILDILIVAFGFSLRVKMGGVIAQLPVTEWLNIMIFLLALFIAIGKRYDDLYINHDSGIQLRKSIKGYSIELLNIYLAMVSGVIIVAYILYTISPGIQERFGTHRLYYTTVFVIAGLLRYLQIVYVKKASGSPTKILYQDTFLQVCILLWIVSFYAIIYSHNSIFT